MKKIFLIAFLTLFSLSSSAQAICEGPLVPCGRSGTLDCGFCHIFELLSNILAFILTCLAPIMAALMLIVGGFYFLTAGTSPAALSKAKGVVTAVVVGLVIVFASWVFLNTFMTSIGLADWSGVGTDLTNWWEIRCQ